MKPAKHKHTVIVGIFVFVAMIILLAGVLFVGSQKNSFEKTIIVNAIFTDVGGLLKGNNIWFAGVKIGTVKHIEIDREGLAKVQMKIEEKSRHFLYKDAKVRIGMDGLIGNRILVISGGTPGYPVNNGDTLQTEIPLRSADMMNTLQESNKNLSVITSDFKVVSRRLANGEGTVGKLLTNDSIARQLQATSAILHDASINIQLLTANMADYTGKFRQKGVLANELVTDTTLFSTMRRAAAEIKQASANAKEMTAHLNEATNNLKDSSNVAGVLLYDRQAAGNIRTSIENIQSGTKKFDEDMEALQHNFLFRRFFKKREKQRQAEQKSSLISKQP